MPTHTEPKLLYSVLSISINGRLINFRGSGQHVGEMALIDSSARRSATVTAIEDTIVGTIGEPAFAKIADRHPDLWRRIAIELGDRLRQRTPSIRAPNSIPHIFIGSSKEALPVARAIQEGLAGPFNIQIWENETFLASDTTIESLEQTINQSDFAILVLAPDDDVVSRDVSQRAPRDNVVFELGLFMGALGRRRTYIVSPAYTPMKMPSDLLGITPLYYSQDNAIELPVRMATACDAIRERVLTLKPK
jgi:CRP/FNR family cyclic AMP-dependent transcriptional regulator